MARILTVAAAQLGGIQYAESRAAVVARMIALMELAADRGADLVVYPELALTTFFPRYNMEDDAAIDAWFEAAMPSEETRPLFDVAGQLGVGFHLGYAEKTPEGRRFNTAIMVAADGTILGKYRKIHLPGHAEYDPSRVAQHLEKKYFEVGDLGFNVFAAHGGIFGMMICNDRRWPEAWRMLGLQGVEMVVLGYNTPSVNTTGAGFEDPYLRTAHSNLAVQAGAYQNSCWAVAVAKAGDEDGHGLIGSTCIVNPQGEIVAKASSWDDELVVANCDLDMTTFGKQTIFNFAAHRQPEHYKLIVESTGVDVPLGIRGGKP